MPCEAPRGDLRSLFCVSGVPIPWRKTEALELTTGLRGIKNMEKQVKIYNPITGSYYLIKRKSITAKKERIMEKWNKRKK